MVPSVKSIEGFHQLLNARPSCSRIGWSFFGVPLSGLSAISSLAILLLMVRNAIQREEKMPIHISKNIDFERKYQKTS